MAAMRERQARLLLEINSLVAEIPDASATTIEDFLALLDVALEHELDLAPEIAFYGPADYPIITRLMTRRHCPRTAHPSGSRRARELAPRRKAPQEAERVGCRDRVNKPRRGR